MFDWLKQNEALLFWLAMLSVGSLVLAALLLPVIVVRLPADYFVRERLLDHGPRRALDWCWHIGKNLFGALFVLAGIAMLVLPGQGLLTILIGMLLMDFPGKRALERRLIGRPKILAQINRLRQRRGSEPLRMP
jgi:hypothetical protein